MATTYSGSTCPLLEGGTPASPLRILVSWSPGSRGIEPIEFAAWLSRTTTVKVQVVSAFTQPWHSMSLQKLGGKYKKWFKREQEACAQVVRETLLAAGIGEHCWAKEYSVLADGPSKPQLLTEAARRFGADVVLLGPNQAAPKGRFMAGSTADALLHYSPTTLGLTPRAVKLSKHGVRRVNFAFTDEGARSDDPGLLKAARMAAAWEVPLRILAFSASGLVDAPLHDRIDVAAELTSKWRESSLALLDVARDAVLDEIDHLEVSSDLGSGKGWHGAVDALKWKKGDLMCLSSDSLGPIERVFIGSTATEILPHLRVPVLVMPTGGAPSRTSARTPARAPLPGDEDPS